MTRIALTDGSGRWFDVDKAEVFKEATIWDGHNHVSAIAGEKFAHQELYRTAGKQWILHTWSQWQGVRDTWTEISKEDAAKWLVICDEEHADVQDDIAKLEVE
jgi:hypothetical protein